MEADAEAKADSKARGESDGRDMIQTRKTFKTIFIVVQPVFITEDSFEVLLNGVVKELLIRLDCRIDRFFTYHQLDH